MKPSLLFTGIILLVIANAAKSQTDSTAVKNKFQFKLGVYYNTNLNYLGRADSLRSSGFFPMAEFWFGEHFYINAAPIFVHNKVQSFEYAGSVATAGYMFNDRKKWMGNFYVVKPIYKDNSALVQSALQAQVTGSVTFQNKILNITGGGDVKFSEGADFGATVGLDHIFKAQLPGQSVLVVDPSVYVYAGTQKFTSTYYKNLDILGLPGAEQEISEKVNRFNILSYEVSMPIVFAKKRFQLLLIPAYVMPQNLVSIPNRPDLSERGEDMFYATIGAKVIF
jgi:hypothetical protein